MQAGVWFCMLNSVSVLDTQYHKVEQVLDIYYMLDIYYKREAPNITDS